MALLDYERIASLESVPMPQDDELLAEHRVIARTKRFTIVYGPFTTTANCGANIVFVGLTPGYQQLQLATRIVREHPAMTAEERALELRRHVAFAGSMRRNLISMCDELGLPDYLHIPSTGHLFTTQPERMFATSALLYRVFTSGWKNYGGGPEITQEPVFIEMLERLLGPLLASTPKALIVPFGATACMGVMTLVKCRIITEERVLRGFPHPSGANGHRKRIFAGNKHELVRQLSSWFA